MTRSFFLAAILVALAPTVGPAQTTPRPGSPVRAAILEAVRSGTGTRARFIVDHLKVGGSVAFIVFRAQSADGSSGQAFLTRRGTRWILDWAVAGGGATHCATLSRLYDDALRRADRLPIFTSEFLAEAAETQARARDNGICLGDILAGPQE